MSVMGMYIHFSPLFLKVIVHSSHTNDFMTLGHEVILYGDMFVLCLWHSYVSRAMHPTLHFNMLLRLCKSPPSPQPPNIYLYGIHDNVRVCFIHIHFDQL